MEALRLGGRFLLEGRLQTLGLEASRKAKRFAITAAAPRRLTEAFGQDEVVPSHRLLAAVAIEQRLQTPRKGMAAIKEFCPPEDMFLHNVFRFHPDHMLIGVVTAIRGSVRFRLGDRRLIVRDLIELRFDEKACWRGASFDAPPLAPEDAGALVTTDEGQIVGLLVGGAGYLGYAAPVEPFLRENGLVHRRVGNPDATDAALASLEAELAREPSFGLEQYLEAA
ncbi:MAG TPA: hypothetical protein VF782_13480 [Allosphingosinicella sp.]|jgi:hypothetical protein